MDDFKPVELDNGTKDSIPKPEQKPENKSEDKCNLYHQDETSDQRQKMVSQEEMVYPNMYSTQYYLRKFFVCRPGALDQAIEDMNALIAQKEENGRALSFWLLTEVDHWNNEKERIVAITEKSLVICKYDFMMLASQQVQCIPLNYIDKICHGPFTVPPKSLAKREGNGLRIYWDKLRDVSFLSLWNPWSTDLPYTSFTEHPVKNANERFATICELEAFTAQLIQAVKVAHEQQPVAGRANGAVILKQPIPIEAYTGLMAFIGNRNKLGYSLARGNVGF